MKKKKAAGMVGFVWKLRHLEGYAMLIFAEKYSFRILVCRLLAALYFEVMTILIFRKLT